MLKLTISIDKHLTKLLQYKRVIEEIGSIKYYTRFVLLHHSDFASEFMLEGSIVNHIDVVTFNRIMCDRVCLLQLNYYFQNNNSN